MPPIFEISKEFYKRCVASGRFAKVKQLHYNNRNKSYSTMTNLQRKYRVGGFNV